MAEHLEGLRAAVAAVRITSASSFTWFGAPAYRLASRWTSTLSAQAVAIRLAAALADQLYCGYYTRGAAAPADPAELGWLPDPHRAVTDPGSSRRVWRASPSSARRGAATPRAGRPGAPLLDVARPA